MKKKDSGQIGDYIILGIGILLFTLLIVVFFTNAETVQKKIDINQLSRQYILRMETVGYLTADDRAELTTRLNDIGVTEVSFSGTTLSQVGYGNDIVLEFTGNLHYREITLSSLFSPQASDGVISVHEKRFSTAKN